MKVLILASLLSAAAVPMAVAAENTAECQIDETRRAAQQRAAPPAAPTVARPTTAAQEARTANVRRRSGKRIPDAELIGPRGSL